MFRYENPERSIRNLIEDTLPHKTGLKTSTYCFLLLNLHTRKLCCFHDIIVTQRLFDINIPTITPVIMSRIEHLFLDKCQFFTVFFKYFFLFIIIIFYDIYDKNLTKRTTFLPATNGFTC
jgi:hypothetical protein